MYEKLPDAIARRFLEGLLALLFKDSDEENAEFWEESVDEIAGAIGFRLKHPHHPQS